MDVNGKLTLKIRVIVSFEVQCAPVQHQNNEKPTRPRACGEHWTVNIFVELGAIMTWKWSIVMKMFVLSETPVLTELPQCCPLLYMICTRTSFKNGDFLVWGTIPVELINRHCCDTVIGRLNAPSWAGLVHQRWQVANCTMPWRYQHNFNTFGVKYSIE